MEQFNISGLDVFKNSRMKYYIDSSGRRVPYEFMVCNRQIFSDKGFEESDASKAVQKELDYRAAMQELQQGSSFGNQHYKPEPRSHEELLDASRRRARRKIFDYLICNEWEYFLTLTLDGEKIGRDYASAIKKLNTFLGNRVRRHGLKYIGVPEYHKRGGVHFHFAVSGGGFHLVDSGTVSIDGRKKPVKIATAKRLGVRAIIAPMYQRTRYGAVSGLTYGISPDKLVEFVAHAKYVLAGSFHGTVLATIFGKPMLSLRMEADNPDYPSRPGGLLKLVGQEKRLVTPDVSIDDMIVRLTAPIPSTNKLLQAKETSITWLKRNLE